MGAAQYLRTMPYRAWLRDWAGACLYGLGLTQPRNAGGSRLTIVTFHRVLPAEMLSEYPLPELVVSTDEFRWLMAYFLGNYTIGPVSAVRDRWEAGERPSRPFLAITFDDGQIDNYLYAAPILGALGACASFYVPAQAIMENGTLWHDRLGYAASRLIAKDEAKGAQHLSDLGIVIDRGSHRIVSDIVEQAKGISPVERGRIIDALEGATGGQGRPSWDGMMSWDQLRALISQGHEVGSHSMTHPLLDTLDDAAINFEVGESRRLIEHQLGKPITSFCYPNGNYDARVLAAVARAGYSNAVTTQWGSNAPGAAPLELTRCDIQSTTLRSRKGQLSRSRIALRMSPLAVGL